MLREMGVMLSSSTPALLGLKSSELHHGGKVVGSRVVKGNVTGSIPVETRF